MVMKKRRRKYNKVWSYTGPFTAWQNVTYTCHIITMTTVSSGRCVTGILETYGHILAPSCAQKEKQNRGTGAKGMKPQTGQFAFLCPDISYKDCTVIQMLCLLTCLSFASCFQKTQKTSKKHKEIAIAGFEHWDTSVNSYNNCDFVAAESVWKRGTRNADVIKEMILRLHILLSVGTG